MIRHENECVQCGLPCYPNCRYKNVMHMYCDHCGEEADALYTFDGDDYCLDCAWNDLQKADIEYCDICGVDGDIRLFDDDGMIDEIPICKSCLEDKLERRKCYGEF